MMLFSRYFYFLIFPCLLWAEDTNVSFKKVLKQLKVEAIEKGFSAELVDKAFDGIQKPDSVVTSKYKRQPERKITLKEYQKNVLSKSRIREGVKNFKKHRFLLEKIAQKYKVEPEVIVALWGIESHYGSYYKPYKVIPSLVTLIYRNHRKKFFKIQLFDALKMVKEKHVSLDELEGSWSGAVGQVQFMPSSFHSYAVDGDGDLRKNIWDNYADIFASAANYLKRNGWKYGKKWGVRVDLPKNFSARNIGFKNKKYITRWSTLGVKQKNGKRLEKIPLKGYIIQPDGKGSQAYLVYHNAKVLYRWNHSLYFVTTVGLLSDIIKMQK